MVVCVAYGCRTRSGNKDGISTHRFPKDPQLLKLWLIKLRRIGFKPSATSVVCSLHFSKDDLNKTLNRVYLKEGAVPQIFPGFPPHLQPKQESEIANRYPLWADFLIAIFNYASNQSRSYQRYPPSKSLVVKKRKPPTLRASTVKMPTESNDQTPLPPAKKTRVFGPLAVSTPSTTVTRAFGPLTVSTPPATKTRAFGPLTISTNSPSARPSNLTNVEMSRPPLEQLKNQTPLPPSVSIQTNDKSSQTIPVPSKDNLERKIQLLEGDVKSKQKKIIRLNETVRRLKKRVETLTEESIELRKQCLLSEAIDLCKRI